MGSNLWGFLMVLPSERDMGPLSATQKRLILVCCNQKNPSDPTLCGNVGAMGIWEELKAYSKEKGLQKEVRVVKSGCLDYCGKGPIVCIQPEQQWYQGVKKEDVEKIKKEWIDSFSSTE